MSKPYSPTIVLQKVFWEQHKEVHEAMRRALLAVEKSGIHWDTSRYPDTHCCPSCFEVVCVDGAIRHHVECIVDEALTKAGLPDQESRDNARREIGL